MEDAHVTPTPHTTNNATHASSYGATRTSPAPFTCGRCDTTWTGLSMAHCGSGCHYTFGSVRSFDRHRRHGGCAPPPLIGLTYNEKRRCWSEPFFWGRGDVEQARAAHPAEAVTIAPSYRNDPTAPHTMYAPKRP